jgi:hypothetical protein
MDCGARVPPLSGSHRRRRNKPGPVANQQVLAPRGFRCLRLQRHVQHGLVSRAHSGWPRGRLEHLEILQGALQGLPLRSKITSRRGFSTESSDAGGARTFDFCVEQCVHRMFVFMELRRARPGRCVEQYDAWGRSSQEQRIACATQISAYSVVKEQRLAASASGELAFANTGTATSDYRSRVARSGDGRLLDRGLEKGQLYETKKYIVPRYDGSGGRAVI